MPDPLVGLEDERRAALAQIAACSTVEQFEQARVTWLGRQGAINRRFSQLAGLTPEQRRLVGPKLNAWKQDISQALDRQQALLARSTGPHIDRTLPGQPLPLGHMHPISQFAERVLDTWRSFGFDVHEGPEVETAWFNFDGLNVPADHPARDVQDTFFIADHPELVLRTHSSTVQLHWPKTHQAKPPFRAVEIGKVYRHEATDATHESMFFQCDGVAVDRHINLAHLVTILKEFMQRMYPGKRVRIRPSFFPFVEPGIELDVWWEQPGKPGRWLEMLGAGLIHPNVLRAMGLRPSEWQGCAFGMGFDRLVMLEFGVTDIRNFYNGNIQFLQQF